jgi:hypothetical protein
MVLMGNSRDIRGYQASSRLIRRQGSNLLRDPNNQKFIEITREGSTERLIVTN